MAGYLFTTGGMKNFIAIPANVADKYLKECSGDELKALLYLIRNEDRIIEPDAFSAATGIPEENIEAVLGAWVKRAVLQKKGTRYSLSVPSFEGSVPKYSSETIALRTKNNREWDQLKRTAEKMLGKMLTENDINTLFSFNDYLGLPESVIALLLDYCSSSGKTGMRYIEKVAINWADEQIFTVEEAQKKIDALNESKQMESRIKTALGIGSRNLTTKEKEYISKWTEEYGYGIDEIIYAFELSCDNTGSMKFGYMDGVLSKSYAKGLKTLEDMKSAPKPVSSRVKRTKKDGDNPVDSMEGEDLFVPFWEVSGDEDKK